MTDCLIWYTCYDRNLDGLTVKNSRPVDISKTTTKNLTSRCSLAWFEGTPQAIARKLLGCQLVRHTGNKRLAGIIVEVEAYLSTSDPASHSAIGHKNRNATMFARAGHLYVYSIHSRHCLNVVTEPAGTGSAVLIRAIEPVDGIDVMIPNRQSVSFGFSTNTCTTLRHLTSGPGKLCEALCVDRSLDGTDLTTSADIWIEPAPQSVRDMRWKIGISPRIGIRQGSDLMLRWFIDGHQLVSGKARDHQSGRNWRFYQ